LILTKSRKPIRSLDFHHKLFEVSKSRLKAIYFLGLVRVRRLVADNQSPQFVYETIRNPAAMPLSTL
jgi:hypothetical protein